MTPLTILYVDDEPDIREITTFALELDPQIEVRAADSGGRALAMLDTGASRPDLLLLDVMMPDMDGPMTLAQIRQRPEFAAIPAVFITARAQPHERDHLLALGAIGVITKPFDPMALAADIRALLTRE